MSQACINVYVDRYDYTNHMASEIIQAFTKGLLRADFNCRRSLEKNKNRNYGEDYLQAVIKKWFREKEYGFLDNGSGPDIMVRKADLVNCQYLKIGSSVKFECHIDNRGLVAKSVSITKDLTRSPKKNVGRAAKPHYFGVMK